MYKLGSYQILKVDEESRHGYFLVPPDGLPEPSDENDDVDRPQRVLLPGRMATKKPRKGDLIRVFLYKDNEERLTATMQEPAAEVGQAAFLEARNVDDRGAWLKWGLDKDLFVPYREQNEKMEAGRSYIVHIYIDEKTGRLAASARIDAWLDNTAVDLKPRDEVELLVWQKTDLGYKVIINNRHRGLVYHSEIFSPVSIGMRRNGFIKNIREDQNIDVSFREIGFERASGDAETILNALEKADGFLDLHDKSSPNEVQSRLHMSKRAFKQAVGGLLKSGKIELESDGIRLVKSAE